MMSIKETAREKHARKLWNRLRYQEAQAAVYLTTIEGIKSQIADECLQDLIDKFDHLAEGGPPVVQSDLPISEDHDHA